MPTFDYDYIVILPRESLLRLIKAFEIFHFILTDETRFAFIKYYEDGFIQHPLIEKPYFNEHLFNAVRIFDHLEYAPSIEIIIHDSLQVYSSNYKEQLTFRFIMNNSYAARYSSDEVFVEFDKIIKYIRPKIAYEIMSEVVESIIDNPSRYIHEQLSISNHMYIGEEIILSFGRKFILDSPVYFKSEFDFGKMIILNCKWAGNVIFDTDFHFGSNSYEDLKDNADKEWWALHNYFHPKSE